MKLVFYFLFALLNAILIFKIIPLYKKEKLLLYYGVSLVLIIALYFIFAIFSSILMGILIKFFQMPKEFVKFYQQDHLSNYLDYMFFSCITLLMSNVIITIGEFILDMLINFHKTYNTNNINKKPIKFVIEKKSIISQIIKIFFLLNNFLVLYGVWFGKK